MTAFSSGLNIFNSSPHIYAPVNWVSIGSDTALSPIRLQAMIMQTNAGLLLIGPLRTNFSEI